ncbi:MAG: hypothetical protein ABI024_02460 [Vicinamibacterales bacterium]
MTQNQRIERLKAEAHRLSGGEMESFGIDNLPPDIAEQFLQRVIAFETAPMVTDLVLLTADGVKLPDPETVSDDSISAVLWGVIVALSKHQVFLERTNHLSDRELYAVLWHNVLREEHAALPEGDTGAWHVDVPGDDERATNFLTYYASKRERCEWQKDCPDFTVPAHRDPAYDRDRALPKPVD